LFVSSQILDLAVAKTSFAGFAKVAGREVTKISLGSVFGSEMMIFSDSQKCRATKSI
jgi:hypothetical protein